MNKSHSPPHSQALHREALADARLDILTALESRIKADPRRPLLDAMASFAAAYKAGEIEVDAETRSVYPSVSRSTLHDWRLRRAKAKREGGGARTALKPGCRAPRTVRRTIDSDTALSKTIAGLMVQYLGCSSRFVMRELAKRFATERIPSRRTIKRWMKRWREENWKLLAFLTDPDGYRRRFTPAIGRADADVVRLNQRWEADSTSADVQCTDGAMQLIVVQDIYSRRARVLVTPTSRTTAILALVRRCLLDPDWGVPETLVTDNGGEYKSKHITRVLSDIEIDHDLCLPYDPNGKPHVERFIGTISRDLFRYLPGFKGHSIAENQQIRARAALSERRGKGLKWIFNVELSSAELQAACDRWIEEEYETREHDGLKERVKLGLLDGSVQCTPSAVADAWPYPRRVISNERALDILLAPPAGKGTGTVTSKGIRADKGTYWHPALNDYLREDVEILQDATDYGVLYVRELGGKFICWAADSNREGFDRKVMAAKNKAAQREIRRDMRAKEKQLIRDIRPELLNDEILTADENPHYNVAKFPRRAAEHNTPASREAGRAASTAAEESSEVAAARQENLLSALRSNLGA